MSGKRGGAATAGGDTQRNGTTFLWSPKPASPAHPAPHPHFSTINGVCVGHSRLYEDFLNFLSECLSKWTYCF